MGLFGKTIKCSYCNKSVKESYAMDVGICPHCSKRLTLNSNNTTFDTCQHSDGSSHKGYSYESNTFDSNNNSSAYKSTTSTTTRTQTDTTYSTNNSIPNNTNSYRNTSNRRAPIDADYIRQINQEANRLNSDDRFSTNPGLQRYIPGSNSSTRNVHAKEVSTKTAKIIRIGFIAFFVIQFIIPLAVMLFNFLAFSNEEDEYEDLYSTFYDDPYTSDVEDLFDDIYDDYQNSDDMYYDDHYTPSSQVMQMYLPLYFDKDFDSITQEDLDYIKGITVTYNKKLERLYVYIYNADDKGYKEFLNNGYLDIYSLTNQPDTFRKGTFEVTESLLYSCVSEIMSDMICFTNLEYIYVDQDIPTYFTYGSHSNLTAFIAPNVCLDSNIFANPEAIEYLSVDEISDADTASIFTNLKAFSHQNKYYMQSALDELYSNNPSMEEFTHIILSDTFN